MLLSDMGGALRKAPLERCGEQGFSFERVKFGFQSQGTQRAGSLPPQSSQLGGDRGSQSRDHVGRGGCLGGLGRRHPVVLPCVQARSQGVERMTPSRPQGARVPVLADSAAGVRPIPPPSHSVYSCSDAPRLAMCPLLSECPCPTHSPTPRCPVSR